MKGALSVVGAAIAGCMLLAYVVPRAHPAASWNVRFDRQQSIVRAREISAAFGFDVSSWSALAAANNAGKPEYFQRTHPGDDASRRFSSVYPKVAFSAPGRPYRIAVELS